jgi:hypothetical protein
MAGLCWLFLAPGTSWSGCYANRGNNELLFTSWMYGRLRSPTYR